MLTMSSPPHMAEEFQQQTHLNLADRTQTHPDFCPFKNRKASTNIYCIWPTLQIPIKNLCCTWLLTIEPPLAYNMAIAITDASVSWISSCLLHEHSQGVKAILERHIKTLRAMIIRCETKCFS